MGRLNAYSYFLATNPIEAAIESQLAKYLGGTGLALGLVWYVIRQGLNYQQNFTNYYIAQNKTLKDEVDELRAEREENAEKFDEYRTTMAQQVQTLREQMVQLQLVNGQQANKIEAQSNKIDRQEREINRLKERINGTN